ncbi:MAG: PAS domain S-box protein, partial [Spirochaetota bacterium]
YDEAGEPFDCEYLKVNEAFERHTGVPAQTFVGKTFWELYPGEETHELIELYAGVVASRNPVRHELYFPPMDRWFELSVFPTRDDEFTVVVQNVTARKHSEQIIAAEKEWLNVTLQSVGDAVIATDVDGKVAVMNAVAEKLTGWKADDAQGRPLSEVFCIVSSLTRGACEDPVERVIREGEVVGLANHTVLVSADGCEYQIADSAAPIKDARGAILGVVLVFRDVTEEYRVAQALADSERDMARAQAMAQLGSWRLDLDTGVVTGSDQARKIYGASKGELSFEYVKSFPLAEDRSRLDAAMGSLIRDGTPYDVEFRIRRPSDDSLRWIHSIAEYDAEHNRIVGTLHDITEHKEMEEALRESEQHFRTLADSGQALIWTSGVDGACNYFNRPWLEFTGRAFEQEVGTGWIEGVHPDDRDRCVETYLAAFDRHEPFSMVYRLRRADGEYRWIQDDGTPRYDSRGEFLGYIGHCLDTTDLKDAEAATRREHARFAMIAETSPVGITTVDEDGNITYANSAAERTLGLARYEITSRTYDEPAWQSTDLDGMPLADEKQPFYLVKTSGRPVHGVEHAILRPDGARVDLSINGSPILDGDGEFRGMVATIEDITERVEAGRRIRALVAEKERALAESHHRVINNMGIVTSLLSLHANAAHDEASRGVLRDAAARVQSMVGLYNRLYRREADGPVSIAEFLPPLVEEIAGILDPSGSLSVDVAADNVELDQKTLQTIGIVVNELMTNSVKHAFAHTETGRIVVTASQDGSGVAIVYQDNGRGAPAAAVSGESGGFGMQLVRAMIGQIGGSVAVDPNGGMQVTMELPR